MEPGLKKESAGVEKVTNNNTKSNVTGVEEDGSKSTKQPEPDDNVCATLNLTKVLFLYLFILVQGGLKLLWEHIWYIRANSKS